MKARTVAVVTGGAGFIGSHMVDLLLAKELEVRVIDNLYGGRLENLEHVRAHPHLSVEVRDIRSLAANDPLFSGADHVFHFAGIGDIVPSIDQPVDYMSANVMGTVHVLECARFAKVKKVVYAASSSCFGLAKQLPTTEDADKVPEYPYALSKYLGEQAALHWAQIYSLPVNSIRMFNVYGPRSRTTGAYGAVFGVFLAQKLKNMPFTVVGDGEQTRDFVYVTDVANAFLQVALLAKSGEVYNLGAGHPQSVNRLVELLGGEITHIPKRPGEPDCTWADISKIQRDIGWKAEVSFEQGVQAMLENIDYWRQAPVWNAESIKEATRGWFDAFTRKGEV